jgi:hypothetical protein
MMVKLIHLAIIQIKLMVTSASTGTSNCCSAERYVY